MSSRIETSIESDAVCELIQYKPSVNFRAHPAISSSRGSPAPWKSASSRILRWHSAAHRAASAFRRQRASREARPSPATPLLAGKLGAIESPGDVGRDRPSVNSRSGSVASSWDGRGLGRGSQASSSSLECAGPENGCWKPMSGSIPLGETLGEETSVAARISSASARRSARSAPSSAASSSRRRASARIVFISQSDIRSLRPLAISTCLDLMPLRAHDFPGALEVHRLHENVVRVVSRDHVHGNSRRGPKVPFALKRYNRRPDMSSWRLNPEKRTPQGSPRGETESRFFGGMPGQQLQTVPVIPTGDSWSFGLRRRIPPSPADMGWNNTMTPGDARTCFAVPYKVWEVPPKRSRITLSPGASLHPARITRRCVRLFAESDHPSDHVGETFNIPSTSLATPSVLLPREFRLESGKAGSPTK